MRISRYPRFCDWADQGSGGKGLGTVFGLVMGAAIQGVIFMARVLAFRYGVIGEIAHQRKITL